MQKYVDFFTLCKFVRYHIVLTVQTMVLMVVCVELKVHRRTLAKNKEFSYTHICI